MRHASAPQNFIQVLLLLVRQTVQQKQAAGWRFFLFPFCRWTEGRRCRVCGFSLVELSEDARTHGRRRSKLRIQFSRSCKQEPMQRNVRGPFRRRGDTRQESSAIFLRCIKLWSSESFHVDNCRNDCMSVKAGWWWWGGWLWFSPTCSFLTPRGLFFLAAFKACLLNKEEFT